MSLATVARSVAIAVAVLVASISPEAFAGGKGPDGYERWSDDIVDLPPVTALEGIRGIAIATAQRAAGQTHENGTPAHAGGLALQ